VKISGATLAVIAVAILVPAMTFAVAVMGVIVHASTSQDACVTGAPAAMVSQLGANQNAVNSLPANYLADYQKAGAQSSIPWPVLAGIGKVESDHGQSTEPGVRSGHNYAGAEGPMQFLPGTWAEYGDGNPQDVYNPDDAIPATTRMLRANGAPADEHKAIFAYNHSDTYVADVLSWATTYSGGDYSIDGNNTPAHQPACKPSSAVPPSGGTYPNQGSCNVQASPKAMIAIKFACSKLGQPYQWGGTGPLYDCSGLTQAAWAGAGVQIGRTTWDQWNNVKPHLSYDQLQPGDLVWFYSDLGHIGMYLGGGMFIQDPETNDHVKISDMSTGYYRQQFQGGGNPAP
jgi:cell wall-associated NlpC family hydrolase